MMLSKILTGAFVLIMVGAIVAGAIAVFGPAEKAHAGTEAREREPRLGFGAQAETGHEGQSLNAEGQLNGRGQGQGQGRGRSQNLAQGQGQEQSQGQGRGRAESTETTAAPIETETVEGMVVALDDLVIETASGETVQIGLGPSTYRESLGFVLQTNQEVRVLGYWEDDEFKATQLENLTTGQSIVLRDATGRPMWAGQGRGKNRNS